MEVAGDPQLVLLFWAQRWMMLRRAPGTQLLCLLPPGALCSSMEPSWPGSHHPHKGKQQILYVDCSPPWFSCHLPTLVDVNKLVDLVLLCRDTKIYF